MAIEASQFRRREVPFTPVKETTSKPKGKLLLVHLEPYERFPGSFSEPVGIQQLAGTLIEKRVPIEIHLGLVKNKQQLHDAIEVVAEEDYTHVGLSMPLGSLDDSRTFIERISLVNSARTRLGRDPIDVLIGGNLPTSIPVSYMTEVVEEFPFVTVIRGWGDKPLTDIMQHYTDTGGVERENIPGLIFHDGQEVKVNPLELDDPDFKVGQPLHLLLEPDMVPSIGGSRDCSHPHCTFCARFPLQPGMTEVWRPLPAEDVVEQIIDLGRFGIKQGSFTDEEALGTTEEHAVARGSALSRTIIQAKQDRRIDPDFVYAFSTRSDSIVAIVDAGESSILRDLHDSGLTRIFLGVESGIPSDFERWDGLDIPPQGRRYGKGIDVKDHIRAVNALKKADIGIEIGFIPFDPLMDLAEIRENANFLLHNDLARHTSAIFNFLRLQSGARYERVVNSLTRRLKRSQDIPQDLNLLGDLDPSTLQRDYSYLHPLVGEMVNLFKQIKLWDRERRYKLNSYYRSKLITGEPTSGRAFETLTQLRELDMHLMIDSVNWAEAEMQRRDLPISQYDILAPEFTGNGVVRQIRDDCLGNRQSVWDNFLAGDMPDYLRIALKTNDLVQ